MNQRWLMAGVDTLPMQQDIEEDYNNIDSSSKDQNVDIENIHWYFVTNKHVWPQRRSRRLLRTRQRFQNRGSGAFYD